jgi:hypothetical protein
MEAIMTNATSIAWTLAMFLSAGAPAAWAHGEDDTPRTGKPEKLGEVNFPVSCNAAAQKEFNRAMALFHSFWFDPAKKSFAKVLEHDPSAAWRTGALPSCRWGIP